MQSEEIEKPDELTKQNTDSQDQYESVEQLKHSVQELTAKYEGQKTEIESMRDRYIRACADTENMKKRFDKERSDLLLFGLEKFCNDMLPVLDSVDNALVDIENNPTIGVDALKSGFELVKKQLTDVLQKHGLVAVGTEQTDFDPNLHQAIQRIESEHATKDTIKQVFVKGYTLNGRLVRPAMVSVEVPN